MEHRIDTESVNYDPEKMDRLFLEIGRNIHKERIKRGLEVSEFARLCNLSPSQVYKAESGQIRYTLETIIKICTALGIGIERVVPLIAPENISIRSNGERFNDIVTELDVSAINHIFDVVKIMAAYEKEYAAKKRRSTKHDQTAGMEMRGKEGQIHAEASDGSSREDDEEQSE